MLVALLLVPLLSLSAVAGVVVVNDGLGDFASMSESLIASSRSRVSVERCCCSHSNIRFDSSRTSFSSTVIAVPVARLSTDSVAFETPTVSFVISGVAPLCDAFVSFSSAFLLWGGGVVVVVSVDNFFVFCSTFGVSLSLGSFLLLFCCFNVSFRDFVSFFSFDSFGLFVLVLSFLSGFDFWCLECSREVLFVAVSDCEGNDTLDSLFAGPCALSAADGDGDCDGD